LAAGPFVLCETPDEELATTEARLWHGVALHRDEALADERYRGVLAAWDAMDDTGHAAWLAEDEDQVTLIGAARDAEREMLLRAHP
jgi:hypothetical protein